MQNIFSYFGMNRLMIPLMGSAFLVMSGTAQAAYLYWASTPVKSVSVSTCFDFAYSVMQSQNLQGIRRTQSEVAGSSGSMYASITCIKTPKRATAVVMVAGDDGNETIRLRDSLRNQISQIVRFD
jgi:hypothetical protein